jgi:ABC-2 type transport system ATP-binding protein
VEVTIAGDAERAVEAAKGVAGVESVERLAASDAAGDVTTLQIDATSDVRAALARALVGSGVDLLQMAQGERELESVFLELASPKEAERAAPRKKAKDPRKARAAKKGETT